MNLEKYLASLDILNLGNNSNYNKINQENLGISPGKQDEKRKTIKKEQDELRQTWKNRRRTNRRRIKKSIYRPEKKEKEKKKKKITYKKEKNMKTIKK